MNDSRKGELAFHKRNPQRLLFGIADREVMPICCLVTAIFANTSPAQN